MILKVGIDANGFVARLKHSENNKPKGWKGSYAE
jgi:hypothetical protein